MKSRIINLFLVLCCLGGTLFADENLLKQAPDYAVQHWEQEYAELQHEIEKRDDKKALPEKSVSPSNILNRHSLIWDTDRDALDGAGEENLTTEGRG